MVKSKKAAKLDAEITMDRRTLKDRRKSDRRKKQEPVAAERRTSQRRAVQRRRQIDPTTCERDYTNDEIEFMQAMDAYKRSSGRMFPTCSEILEVVRNLGYERKTPDSADDSPEANADGTDASATATEESSDAVAEPQWPAPDEEEVTG